MTDVDINQKLQHPRRSLGNRHRSQAEKFLKMEKNVNNLNWAEQSAKQSVLYDFTNPDNWTISARTSYSRPWIRTGLVPLEMTRPSVP